MTTLVACSKCTHTAGVIKRPRLHACSSIIPYLLAVSLSPPPS